VLTPGEADERRARGHLERARADGLRRLSLPRPLHLAAALAAGAVIALAILAEATFVTLVAGAAGPGVGALAGALIFALGVTVVVAGRLELFAENIYGAATATAGQGADRRVQLLRLSLAALAMNLLGASALAAAFAVEGALPVELAAVLARTGEDVAQTPWAAVLVRGLLAGILLALLSYLCAAVDVVKARLVIAYMIGFLLAIGPFDYVVVSGPRLLFTSLTEGDLRYFTLARHSFLSASSNAAGALLFFAMTRKPARHVPGL
jgi:formate/nitrite transporter FocA (FNT family)